MVKLIVLTLLLFVQTAAAQWIKQTVDTNASLRGLSVVNEKVVWASGTGGTVIRTINGGKTWKVMQVPGAEKLDFRDIEAFDANTAYILSIGNGESSRIYKTTDGGLTWKEQFRNKIEKAFFDAIACWDKNNCIAMSDPVDGKFVLVNTKDGGTNWMPVDTDKMPPAKDGEAAFAASGTCLITQGKNNVYLVTGGTHARVFRSNNRGLSWFVADTPIVKGTSGSGIFSIAMRDAKNGVIVGGNYEKPNENIGNLAFTTDGGSTWKTRRGLGGYRSGIAFVDRNTLIAVGTNGADVSLDHGATWKKISEINLNGAQALGKKFTWAVGPSGVIVKQSELDGESPVRPPMAFVDVQLSHSIISADCSPFVECSDERIITVSVISPVPERAKYVYEVTAGKIIRDGSLIKWDLTNVRSGRPTITVSKAGVRWDGPGAKLTREVIIK